ncbi:uncharacterized protein LOC118014562 isoform X1 [Mirounga leonina]|uniref:uncharacterized protein LOC118014562 isoform X1 n=1 Tax=Mirounga leonina TaxID=9715 RepID=UPI00156C4C02|nr:uncharacterized protein LOC118014562 isoform X1 [Mirounga leonina]
MAVGAEGGGWGGKRRRLEAPGRCPAPAPSRVLVRGVSRAVFLFLPRSPELRIARCGEGVKAVSLNKGDGPAVQATAQPGHCGDAETFPKMAAGARGRGWRGFRSPRGRGGAAGTHQSPWPLRRSPASPPRGR